MFRYPMYVFLFMVINGCVYTAINNKAAPDFSSKEAKVIMKIQINKGGAMLNGRTVTAPSQGFEGGIVALSDKGSQATVSYDNGDKIEIHQGSVRFSFPATESVMGLLDETAPLEKNFNIRNINFITGRVQLVAPLKAQQSKVSYNFQLGKVRLQVKSGDVAIEYEQSARVGVHSGEVTISYPHPDTSNIVFERLIAGQIAVITSPDDKPLVRYSPYPL